MQAITGEELAKGPYVTATGGVEPTTFRTNLHLTNHAPCNNLLSSVHTILVNILLYVRLYIKQKYYYHTHGCIRCSLRDYSSLVHSWH